MTPLGAQRFVPKARTGGVVVERVDGEVLVYDLERHKAHCLNGISAAVWDAADGTRSVATIASILDDVPDGIDPIDLVVHALAQLDERKLLATALPDGALEAGSLSASRRELFKKAALVGAAALAIPVVRSIVAPDVAQAATCFFPGAACASSAQCCSGLCLGNGTCA